jgi:hypothetical protein
MLISIVFHFNAQTIEKVGKIPIKGYGFGSKIQVAMTISNMWKKKNEFLNFISDVLNYCDYALEES